MCCWLCELPSCPNLPQPLDGAFSHEEAADACRCLRQLHMRGVWRQQSACRAACMLPADRTVLARAAAGGICVRLIFLCHPAKSHLNLTDGQRSSWLLRLPAAAGQAGCAASAGSMEAALHAAC